MMKCPECGNEMDEGMINTDGNMLGWTRGALSLKGDTLSWGAAAHLRGHRCVQCRLIAVRY